jgi:hypothetical protein
MARPVTGLVLAWGLRLILGATACGSSGQPAARPTAAASKPAATRAAAKPAAASATSPAAARPAGQVPTDPRPTPVEELYKGCPAEGDGTDPALNRLKNRVDDAPGSR